MDANGHILSKVGKGQIVSKKPLLVSIRQKNSLQGKLNVGIKDANGHILSKVGKGQIVSKKPLLVSIRQKNSLQGKLNVGIKRVIEYVHFDPYVKNTTLFFRTQASVSESELIIRG